MLNSEKLAAWKSKTLKFGTGKPNILSRANYIVSIAQISIMICNINVVVLMYIKHVSMNSHEENHFLHLRVVTHLSRHYAIQFF